MPVGFRRHHIEKSRLYARHILNENLRRQLDKLIGGAQALRQARFQWTKIDAMNSFLNLPQCQTARKRIQLVSVWSKTQPQVHQPLRPEELFDQLTLCASDHVVA